MRLTNPTRHVRCTLAARLYALAAGLTAVCLVTGPACARTAAVVDPADADAALRGVFFLDAQRGWAVGDHGVILGTEDGGRSWGRQATPVECPLSGVVFVDRRYGWAVGGVTTPFTHTSHGVLLHTDNGGYTWNVLPDPLLPRLRGVRFFSRTHGVAYGESSHASPSGVFETRDGGRHWEALHSEQAGDWLAAALPASGAGLLIGSSGEPAKINGAVVEPRTPRHAGNLRAATLDADGRGWAAGDHSLLLKTENAGESWEAVAAAGPIHWRDVTARKRRVWLVGSPGTLIASSEDDGENWRWRQTGVSTPLNAVAFADDRRGWAVGELGVILATDDGGEHWRAQRGGKLRCATLVVAPTVDAAPLELIAKVAAGEGYRTAALAAFADPTPWGPQQDRWREALTGCGASYAKLSSTLPLPRSAREASAAELQETLSGGSVDVASSQLTELVRRHLAMLRPDVVLVAPSSDRGASQLVENAVLAAADGSPDPALQQLGLPAWKPKRVLRVARHRRDSRAGFSTSDFDPRLGTSLAQSVQKFQGLTTDRRAAPPARIGWTALAGGLAPSDANGDPLTGLVVERGGDARRPLTPPDPNGLAALKAVAAGQDAFQSLLSDTAGGSEWANRVLQLTGGLGADAGAQRMLDLADAYRAAGQPRLAADTFYLLARRYPNHALAEHAIDWMLRYYCSSETACHMQAAYEQRQKKAPLANITATLPAQADEWSPHLTLADHQARALTLADYVEQARPVLFSDPRLRLALAAAAREQGQAERGALLLAALGKSSTAEPFRRCVQAEDWLAEKRPTLAKPTLQATRAAERPLLDGRLDEPFWQTGPQGSADPAPAADAGGAAVRIAIDDDFLYLAVAADKLPGGAYPADDAARPRDADLRGYDRVVLRLDVDRDYATAFELSVDCRGWTHDACWGDAAWNPNWYVASVSGESGWSVEAAVPLKELGLDAPPTGAWAFSLQRHSPGRAPQAWTNAAAEDNTPDAYGLLVFPAAPVPDDNAAAAEPPNRD
ncbi:Ycf48-like protein precursor [Posidoniimonas polymericola]|uniref:Ycf48-like protein n=1 Tax=Posidoniimonas polymericola TaxID=2528002 RepID=A0A5C5YTG0_9BACT|nr:YCF48-related protein [Posidoniimonas polymericola]TWT78255.1 Ycf48-like protein precursor [Posidoniimonas polymericola]